MAQVLAIHEVMQLVYMQHFHTSDQRNSVYTRSHVYLIPEIQLNVHRDTLDVVWESGIQQTSTIL